MKAPKSFLLAGTLWLSSLAMSPAADDSKHYVATGKDGRLVYEVDARGNRIPDFSHAGYRGGGVVLPDVPVRVVVNPTNGDNGARIQAAIDYVAQLAPDANGFRGAVLLARGGHEIAGELRINASGVVLRGEGQGANGTVLVATGNSRRTLIQIRGKSDRTQSAALAVTDSYVPVGAIKLKLASVAGLKIGDTVLVERPSTRAWIDAIGMYQFPGRTGGDWRFSWVPGKMDLTWDRVITAVEGNEITLDAPLTTALEVEFGGGTVAKYSWPGRLDNVGVENLRCESVFDAINPHDEEHAWVAIGLEAVQNAWVRQVTAVHFVSSLVNILESCSRVTVEDCESLAPVSELAGWRRHTFCTSGQLTLFQRCRAQDGRHDFVVGYLATGPNVFLDCTAKSAHDFSGAIGSWASGVLFDNVAMDGGALSFDNREIFDQGVGWAAANSAIWQSTAPLITCRQPPTAQNWAIGVWAQFLGNGRWKQVNEFVKPDSLYRAQLAERLGEKTLAALARREIPTAHAGAKSLEETVPDLAKHLAPIAKPSAKNLVLTNGWLTCDGKLVVGLQGGLNWWRGHMLPSRAPDFGPSLTRFAPGRSGLGFTDDLSELTDSMTRSNQVALRHHWGLWYDRRRDDHEMIRRQDADVWPPFYEQPWARTGTGQSWNGLSRYDLTKFNPWYFGRLREFAGLCGQKGLVLVNEMYFQHNILEAGAHWVDFPWRSANNINHTGFPEPPPFTGGKRIFMAEEFYDVTNPVRRELHRAFIRQCLANLADEPNVIHTLGEEFSGPLHFVQFWLDVVGEWKSETGRKPLIALSAPRDVQDAILADAKRAALVDVIDFKYWWISPKGTFAPNGGQNLAPRQYEREWKGGRPTDSTLAQMAAEHRAKFPAKAVMCDFDKAGWAFLCAGGSLPNLPKTMDAKLLAALSRMRPWREATAKDRWVLRESGRQLLVYLGATAPGELDLSGEPGDFSVTTVDAITGQTKSSNGTVRGGGKVLLPRSGTGASVLWLRKE